MLFSNGSGIPTGAPGSQKILMKIKFLFFLLIASVYSAQLTFTTLCTPFMVFNWLLLVRDCSLIYSTTL